VVVHSSSSEPAYDTNLGGYRTNVTENQLRGALAFSRERNWDWSEQELNGAIQRCARAAPNSNGFPRNWALTRARFRPSWTAQVPFLLFASSWARFSGLSLRQFLVFIEFL
jgi:hypothetical protein